MFSCIPEEECWVLSWHAQALTAFQSPAEWGLTAGLLLG